jgi:hypothetical protein
MMAVLRHIGQRQLSLPPHPRLACSELATL